jgi:hypothetical protein
MNLEEAVNVARGLMDHHGLTAKGWQFRFHEEVDPLGACWWEGRTITLCQKFAERCDEEFVIDTLLHEIAHALAGKRDGHSARWRAKARKIGCMVLPEEVARGFRGCLSCTVTLVKE